MEPDLSALAARASRQRKRMALFGVFMIKLDSDKSAEAFHTLVTVSDSWVPYTPEGIPEGMILMVGPTSHEEDFGREGWKTLAETLQLRPNIATRLATTKSILDRGRREDIRKLWDSIGPEGVWQVKSDEHAETLTGEASWLRLEQIMDMSSDDWAAEAEEEDEEEEEEEEEDEGDFEGEQDDQEDV